MSGLRPKQSRAGSGWGVKFSRPTAGATGKRSRRESDPDLECPGNVRDAWAIVFVAGARGVEKVLANSPGSHVIVAMQIEESGRGIRW